MLQAVVGAVFLFAMSGGAFAGNMTLKVAGVLPVEHYAHKMMEQVKADIEETIDVADTAFLEIKSME